MEAASGVYRDVYLKLSEGQLFMTEDCYSCTTFIFAKVMKEVIAGDDADQRHY